MSRRALVVLVIGAGALLVVLGSLFPLYGMETVVNYGTDAPPGGVRRTIAITGWEMLREPGQPRSADDGSLPTYGYSLVAAAVLAAVGAGLQLRSPLPAAIGRFAVVAGFGLAVGTMWTVLETFSVLFGNSALSTEGFVGVGTWIVGGAAVVMLVGVVLAQDWPPRVPRPTGVSVYQVDDVEGDDADTPPFGIAIPVGELDVPAAGAEESGEPGEAAAPPDDDRRHPTGGNPSTVDQ